MKIYIYFLFLLLLSCGKESASEKMFHIYNNMHVLLHHQMEAYKCGCRTINNIEVYDELGNIYDINKLLDTEKLIFWFPDVGCTSCLEEELLNLKESFFNIPTEKIIVISKFDNRRSLRVFKNSNELNCLTVSIDDEILDDCLETISKPCIFISDSSRIIKCLFIPIRDNPQLSKQYYEVMKERFFNAY